VTASRIGWAGWQAATPLRVRYLGGLENFVPSLLTALHCRARTPARKAGFSPWEGKIARDVDSPLEGGGFELSVPRFE
jgi:hypothetical protein